MFKVKGFNDCPQVKKIAGGTLLVVLHVTSNYRNLSNLVSGDQAHLRALLGEVLRPSPWPPQEQLHAQARLKDHDRNLAAKAHLIHRVQVRQPGDHPR